MSMELNNQSIGSYIKAMRQKAGLTQNELAGRIGVGGRTVSKWEQGRGIPDISLLYSLSLELDVDIESLLSGNPYDIGEEWLGIISTGKEEEPGIKEREWERMISMFLLAGIRDVAIVCTDTDLEKRIELLSAYRERGFLRDVRYVDSTEGQLREMGTEKKQVCLLYEPAFLYGMHLTRYMRRAMLGKGVRALILRQGRGSFMPGISFDSQFRCTGVCSGTDSEWHLFPMLFGRGGEVVGYLDWLKERLLMDRNQNMGSEYVPALHVEAMERGMLAFSFQTKKARALAGQVLEGIEASQGIRIGDLEEIMGIRGWSRA